MSGMPNLNLLQLAATGDVAALSVITLAEAEIRRGERERIAAEVAQLARELETAGRHSAAGIVKDMWNRVCRRMDR